MSSYNSYKNKNAAFVKKNNFIIVKCFAYINILN